MQSENNRDKTFGFSINEDSRDTQKAVTGQDAIQEAIVSDFMSAGGEEEECRGQQKDRVILPGVLI